MITMAMQAILGRAEDKEIGPWLKAIYTVDREMVDLVVGLLFHWRPS